MQRILVGLDGSPLAETILPFVESLAGKLGARVTLLHVTSVPEPAPPITAHPSIDQLVARATALAREYLRGPESRLTAAGIDTRIAVASGDAAENIVRYAMDQRCDMIALATHGRSGVQRWAYGSVAERALQTTTVPLLLIRPGDGWAAAPHGMHQLVVPLDGSAEAEAALPIAKPLAVRCGLPLVLLRFVKPLTIELAGDPTGAAYMDSQGIIDGLVQDARSYLENMAATLREQGVTVSTAEVSVSEPADGIATYTRTHSGSFVTLTTHGRSGWRRFLLGSVARRVLHTVAAPILICPPPGVRGSVVSYG
jgi:nucleotide-binding universal stress UspA family protein